MSSGEHRIPSDTLRLDQAEIARALAQHVADELAEEEIPPSVPTSPATPNALHCPSIPPPKETVMKFGSYIGAFARAHAPCSRTHNPAMWHEAVEPKGDRGTAFGKEYFDGVAPSTCALFYAQCLDAGEEAALAAGVGVEVDLVLEEHYKIGSAVGEDEFVGGQHDALELFTPFDAKAVGGQATLPTEPFEEGDGVIINGPPYGVHVICIAGDVVVKDAATWEGPTVQGGQADGGVEPFDTTWHVKNDAHGQPRLFAGSGARYVIAVIRARKFQYDTDDRVADDKTGDTDPSPATLPTGGASGVDE